MLMYYTFTPVFKLVLPKTGMFYSCKCSQDMLMKLFICLETCLYTQFHSAQQNKLYALIQVICLYPYPINIVSDSKYSVFVLKDIKSPP